MKLEPDYVIVLPWNIAEEVKNQFSELRKYETKFVTFIPAYREI